MAMSQSLASGLDESGVTRFGGVQEFGGSLLGAFDNACAGFTSCTAGSLCGSGGVFGELTKRGRDDVGGGLVGIGGRDLVEVVGRDAGINRGDPGW
jgi:hypothetical protein